MRRPGRNPREGRVGQEERQRGEKEGEVLQVGDPG